MNEADGLDSTGNENNLTIQTRSSLVVFHIAASVYVIDDIVVYTLIEMKVVPGDGK